VFLKILAIIQATTGIPRVAAIIPPHFWPWAKRSNEVVSLRPVGRYNKSPAKELSKIAPIIVIFLIKDRIFTPQAYLNSYKQRFCATSF
jgi:hypothetical protein